MDFLNYAVPIIIGIILTAILYSILPLLYCRFYVRTHDTSKVKPSLVAFLLTVISYILVKNLINAITGSVDMKMEPATLWGFGFGRFLIRSSIDKKEAKAAEGESIDNAIEISQDQVIESASDESTVSCSIDDGDIEISDGAVENDSSVEIAKPVDDSAIAAPSEGVEAVSETSLSPAKPRQDEKQKIVPVIALVGFVAVVLAGAYIVSMPKLESVTFDKGYVVVTVGKESDADFSVKPKDYSIENAEITIEDESIAHATDDGTILGHKEGVTDITVTIDDKVSDTCKLYVVNKSDGKIIRNWYYGYEMWVGDDGSITDEKDKNYSLKIYPNHTAELIIDDEVMNLTWYSSGERKDGNVIYNVQGDLTGFWVNDDNVLLLFEGTMNTTRHAFAFYK